MGGNLLVKGSGVFLERRPFCVKVQKILVYSSTAFKDGKEGAVLGAKEKRARDKGLFRRQSGRRQLWGDSVTLIAALSHCLSASP